MAELIITRISAKIAIKLLFKILVDGTEIDEITDAETKKFELSKGTGHIQIG